MTHTWNPDDYHRHSAAQAHWAHELIEKLALAGGERVLDLGCGEGKVTAEIAARLSSGSVLGLDLSRDMIAFSRAHLPPEWYPNLRFVEGDMLGLQFNEEFDVVFSSAALHWVADHGRVFQGISRALRPGGRVFLQMGGRGNAAPILALADEMLAEEPWNELFNGLSRRYAFYDPEEERGWLAEARLAPVRVELIEKDMAFGQLDDLAGWIRTTWHLYLDRLPEEARPAFIAGVVSRYVERYPSADGRIHVPMVRLEVEAVKPSE
ncbi:methyltransferase domain-containing protein [Methanoculleus methanifontis]|uniref:methyltransferase domain-containing protein n=1 Tax=Methanoculleus methanifontis TaxID=2584086 RepID=UPI002657FF20|nr:methyltransferase domain-containing protein [Methanoculleus sp. FWC-SCC3]